MFWSQIVLSLKFYRFQALWELISLNMMCYGVEKLKIAEKLWVQAFCCFYYVIRELALDIWVFSYLKLSSQYYFCWSKFNFATNENT